MRDATAPRAAPPATSIAFRGLHAADMLEGYIHDRSRLASRACRELDACRVVVEAAAADGPYEVRVTLRLNGESVVARESAERCRSCLDLCGLVGTAFDHALAAARRLAPSRSPRRGRRAHRPGPSGELCTPAPVAIHG